MRFEIAGLVFELESESFEEVNQRFVPFLTEKDADYVIAFQPVMQIEKKEDETVFRNESMSVHPGYIDYYNHQIGDEAYARGYYEWDSHSIRFMYTPEGEALINDLSVVFYQLNLQKLLTKENRAIFHASCIDTDFGGILFTGPSGIGKSTQSDLWVEYEDARIINGDKPVLYEEDGNWRAYGSPYSGSSRYFINDSCNIRAIVVLGQSSECTLRKLSSMEAFKGIYSNLVANSWDREFMEYNMRFAERIVRDIPVYEFLCTPDRKAVDILKEVF